jgi:hypothetical protein
MVDHDDKIWIGTWDKGLKKYDPVTKEIFKYFKKICQKKIGTVTETRQPDGNPLIWIDGPNKAFDPRRNKFIHPSIRPTREIYV